jgi:predicted ribosomally synthesized peptide with nif11-like leader
MKDALRFFLQIKEDRRFLKRAKACATEKERLAFLREEGFEFAPEELADMMRVWPAAKGQDPDQDEKDRRKNERYGAFMEIMEINGQPVNDTIVLDISAWGAKIESVIPFCTDSNVEFSFSLPGEQSDEKLKLTGKVVWSGQVPAGRRYKVGLQFYQSIEQLKYDGKFNIKSLQKIAQKRGSAITPKSFLTIKEFADAIRVPWFTVWRWTAENRIEFKQVKAGCKILIPVTELLKFQRQ